MGGQRGQAALPDLFNFDVARLILGTNYLGGFCGIIYLTLAVWLIARGFSEVITTSMSDEL